MVFFVGCVVGFFLMYSFVHLQYHQYLSHCTETLYYTTLYPHALKFHLVSKI